MIYSPLSIRKLSTTVTVDSISARVLNIDYRIFNGSVRHVTGGFMPSSPGSLKIVRLSDSNRSPRHEVWKRNTPLLPALIQFRLVGTFKSTLPPPLGMYVTFGLPAKELTIALLASIFLKATKASPAFSRAREIVAAASASPSARMTAACRSCSACYISSTFFLVTWHKRTTPFQQ